MNENVLFNKIDDAPPQPGRRPLPGDAGGEVLDIQALHDRCMGNLALIDRVLAKFETRLPEELAELERLLEGADATKIALVAHRIKGNSANVSATGLQRAAAEIEELSRTGRVAEIPSRLGNLHDQWQRYVDCRGKREPCVSTTAPRNRGAGTLDTAASGGGSCES